MTQPDANSQPELPHLRPWTLWAKWSSKPKGTWHPLLFHLIDVAMCAGAMWDEVLSPAARQRFADGLGLSLDAARAWAAFLAGLHDIGKACPGFQLQLRLDHIASRLRDAGLIESRTASCEWVAHGTVSAHALRAILPRRYGVARPVANKLATVLGGHHGVFPTASDLAGLPPASLGQRAWEAARLRYAEWLAELLGIEGQEVPQRCAHATAVLLAGFISVVDWLGSDEETFTHAVATPEGQPDLEPRDYLEESRDKAHEELVKRGWLGWSPTPGHLSFEELFAGRISRPRPLQTAAARLAERLHGPALVVVEAPMGEGKTEAAMYLADAWTANGGQRGMYFALPTQTTSNQMFDRVRDFLEHRYPQDVVNLQLPHGHAALSDVVRDMQRDARMVLPRLTAVYDAEDHHPRDGGVIAAEWFASGKRALLAPFGVGTVDQALLAALQVKHFFVRMYGLGAKTIIIDEVHAYDTYMTTLIERLLEWLAALGAPVILLSATLPPSRRTRLLAAYARGAGWQCEERPGQLEAYPRISWVAESGLGQLHCDSSTSRTVALEWVNAPSGTDTDLAALAELLDKRLAGGGCCAVVCNTVGRARTVYTALKQRFPGDADDGHPVVDLFHARYPFEERDKREKRSLDRFGTKGQRPRRAILVATQVVEQSLDLDFDLLVTDLAPVDLILQRAGRLHRHDRGRPPRLGTPTVLILGPTTSGEDKVPLFDRGSTAIYERHILLKTWLELRDRHTLRLPRDIATLVERVYDEDEPPAGISAALGEQWVTSRAEMERHQEADAQEAENRYIKRASAPVDLGQLAAHPREEESPELHPKLQALTRLTEPTVQVICLNEVPGASPEIARIRPDGDLVRLSAKPSLEQTRNLLNRSVRLSDRRVVFALLELEPPKGWQESALLRQSRALPFDAAGVAPVGQARVRLDPELGVLVEGNDKAPASVEEGR